MESLLDQVVQATIERDEGRYPLRITNNDDLFLFMKEGSDAVEKGFPAPDPSPLERFILEKNTEVFERLKILFSQSKLLFFKDGFKWTGVEKKEKRVCSILKSYKLNQHNGSYDFLEAKLLSNDPDDVKTSVFALGSMDDPDVIKRLLLSLAKAPDDFLNCYSEGLKHSISHIISGFIVSVIPSLNKNIQSICLDILLYRSDYSLPEIIDIKDNSLKEKELILRYSPKDMKSVIALEEYSSPESLLRRLISDRKSTVDFLRESEITPDNIILYAMSGDNDHNFIKEIYEKSSDDIVKKSALLAAGIVGTKESVNFLIDNLSDYSDTAAKALYIALGEMLEESTIDSWKKICQKKIQSTERVRKGLRRNTEVLLNEIKNPSNSAFERKTAWKELLVENGIYVYFEPDWLTGKQYKAIERIEKCLR